MRSCTRWRCTRLRARARYRRRHPAQLATKTAQKQACPKRESLLVLPSPAAATGSSSARRIDENPRGRSAPRSAKMAEDTPPRLALDDVVYLKRFRLARINSQL